MPEDPSYYEHRSLKLGMWANLVMGASGLAAAYFSNSDALLVDGLYSGVNFASAIVAARVARSVARPPDARYPFGYEAEESLYVLFRSLVLLGILVFAGFTALDKVVTYAAGGEVPELKFGPIAVYMVAMVIICFGLAAWHRRNWKLTGGRSEILKTESTAAVVDGLISAGAGGALVGVTLLRGTALEGVIPVADAIVVLVLVVIMVGQPAGMLRSAVREVAGRSASPDTTAEVRSRIEAAAPALGCEMLEVAVTKLGRLHFVVPYLKPSGARTPEELDSIRSGIHDSYADLFMGVRSEIIFTAERPFG